VKDSFYEELECVFNTFPKYYQDILLHFNAKVGWVEIFKYTKWNETLHKINNNNVVKVVKLYTSRNFTVHCFHTATYINTCIFG
jgi:hypothetical protein